MTELLEKSVGNKNFWRIFFFNPAVILERICKGIFESSTGGILGRFLGKSYLYER